MFETPYLFESGVVLDTFLLPADAFNNQHFHQILSGMPSDPDHTTEIHVLTVVRYMYPQYLVYNFIFYMHTYIKNFPIIFQ